MSSKTATSMIWHSVGRTRDGMLRHPADALAWKDFDSRYPDFVSDPRSVRLGLASDGFNPFRTLSSTYSTWPVILIPYNMEPWVCMKQSSLILSMVIPGEKGPGNDIDVFLQPLIYELKQLWEGITAFDACTGQNFTMRAALLWTINDFPAYANLSGWSTKGRVACPYCAESTHSKWLKNGGKFCYMGHRRWLDPSHPFRSMKDQFDGKEEWREAPKPPSGTDVLKQLHIKFTYGKSTKSSKKRPKKAIDNSINEGIGVSTSGVRVFEHVDDFNGNAFGLDGSVNGEGMVETIPDSLPHCLWKKRSIFFELPYWEFNLLCHNLDVMHIEKNVCDNLVRTFLNLDGKCKDNYKARLDLVEMGIRKDLHPICEPNNVVRLPHACYTMSGHEKDLFLSVLKNIKVPDGYASNISKSMKDRKLCNLKSHDGHILMQDLLPIALRASMPPEVVAVVSQLSYFFKSLCSKTLDPKELDKLESCVAVTLCLLEQTFLPSFFTIMVHLIIHLAWEAKLGGPVQYRWMYPIERDLVSLKSLVRNRAQPEGSIAEGYIINECLTFCSRYFEGVETIFNRPARNFDQVSKGENYLFSTGGRILGKVEVVNIDDMSLAQAHRYVLLHYESISHFRSEFLETERRAIRPSRSNQIIENRWLVDKFPDWLRKKVENMENENCSDELKAITRGPNNIARRLNGFIINGFRFHTEERERSKKTQNSGVMVEAEGQPYYGKLTDIIELDYYRMFKIVLFRCDWVDVKSPRGLKTDANGYKWVNFTRLIHTGQSLKDDPYVFSSQARQVFYVEDPRNSEWSQVILTKPRDLYDIGLGAQIEEDDDSYTECIPQNLNENGHS